MLDFEDFILDFTNSMDALRDFIGSIRPALQERYKQTYQDSIREVGHVHIARLLASDDLEAASVPAEKYRPILLLARDLLLKADLSVPPELQAEFRNTVTKNYPVTVVDGKIRLNLDYDTARRVVFHDNATKRIRKELRLLNESVLLALTSRSEWFIAQLMHMFFTKHPDAVGTSEPFFSLETLASLGSIEEARDVLIEHKIESLMRQPVQDWLRFFNGKPKLSMGYLDPVLDRIIEVFKRRNLIVHNGGRVSRIYIQTVEEHLRTGLTLGDTIEVDPGYLNDSIDLLELNFVLIGAELWKKLQPADKNRADILELLTAERLLDERWTIARGLSYFTMEDKNSSESSRLTARVNYW